MTAVADIWRRRCHWSNAHSWKKLSFLVAIISCC